MNQTLLLLAIAAANTAVALRIVDPMLPQLALDFATSVPAAAGVITGFAVAQAAAQFIHGPLGDRYGKLRMVTIMLALTALATFGCASASGLNALIGWRFASGVVASAVMTLGMAYLGDVVAAAERQQVLARFTAGTLAGQALGPLVGGVLTDLLGWRATFVCLGLVFAGVAGLLYARTRAQWHGGPAGPMPQTLSLFSTRRYTVILALRPARWVLFSVMVETALFFGAYSYMSALLKSRFDLNYTLIGCIIAGYGLGGVIYTRTVNWMLRRLGQRGMVLWGGGGCGLSYLAIAWAPTWQWMMALTIALGFSFYLVHNTIQTKALEMAPASRATGLALFTTFWALGQAIGVAVVGAGVAQAGLATAVAACGVGFMLFCLVLRSNLHKFP
ncbi:MAG: MFS transporter [Betaproteobacteria bacterium]|nr:MFS transporter [Betaproteobacteria bacterium]